MRTTIVLDDDVAAGVERLRREQSLGLSEAVNELIRRGLLWRRPRKRFRQQSEPLGIKIDVTDIAEALDYLEGPMRR